MTIPNALWNCNGVITVSNVRIMPLTRGEYLTSYGAFTPYAQQTDFALVLDGARLN